MKYSPLSLVPVLLFSIQVIAGDVEDGIRKFKNGDLPGAVTLLEAAEKAGPPRYDVYLYLGNAYFLAGQADRAIKQYAECLELKPGAKEAAVNLASAYSAAGRNQEAIDLYKSLLEKYGDNPDVNYNLAVAYRFSGDLVLAEKYYRIAYSIRPQEAEYVNGLGEILELQGKGDDALQMYNEALHANPNSASPRINLAKLFMARGDPFKAEQEAKAAASMNPSLYAPHEVLGDLSRSKGDVEMAVYEYRAALARNPNVISVNMKLGSISEETGKLDDAKFFYFTALDQDKRSVELNLKLGNLLIRARDYYGARDLLNRAKEFIGKNAALFDLMGQTYMYLRNFDKSEYYLQEALALDSGFTKASLDLGILYFEKGKYTDARGLLENVLKSGHDVYEANIYLGRIYYIKKETSKALELFKKLCQIDAKKLEGYLWTGRAYEQIPDLISAEKSYVKGMEIAKGNPDAYFEAADFYFRNRIEDKFPKSIEFYEKTLEMDSKYPKRDQIIANLDLLNNKIKRITKTKSEKEAADEQKELDAKQNISNTKPR